MASWNIPALINKISEDIPALKGLLGALCKWTDADTTDVPVGAKRLEAVTDGRQIQEKTSSGWASVGKLMHDADTLDGWHAAQSALANHVAVRDSNGKINGDVLGNANTATTASSLAANYVTPIANGGTGANSAAGARQNIGANNASNINAGVLGTASGGTGRTDGKVTDVHLTNYNTGAVGVGQLGSAAAKNATSADSLVVPGVYFCTGCTTALKYPSVNDCFIRTEASGEVGGYTHLVQNLTEAASTKEYRRVSHDGGASWEGWIPVDRTESADVHIYVSKGGSDASTGLASDSAVLTKGRALDIAMGLKVRGQIIFHFGPGEWGDLTVNGGTLQCASVKIVNFPDSAAATAEDYALLTDEGNYGTQPPVFGVLSLQSGVFALGNVNASEVATDGAEILPCDFFVAAAKTVSGNQIGFGFGASNAVESYAPTPAAADDSKKIANTEWVRDATGNFACTSAACSGNAASATKLATARKIDNASFNGTADVVVVPIGAVLYFAAKTAPAKYLVCNGQAVSRTTYSALFAVIGTTYGAGNGSTTFNVPNLIDRFPQGNATPGTVKAAGLPNITGKIGDCPNGSTQGCFTRSGAGAVGADINNSMASKFSWIHFDASKSSNIYGKSSTVQPPALTLLPIIKAL